MGTVCGERGEKTGPDRISRKKKRRGGRKKVGHKEETRFIGNMKNKK